MNAVARKKPKHERPKSPTPDELTPEKIRAIRKARGLSIEEAAEKIGVHPRTLLKWELPRQNRKPSPSHVILLRLLQAGTL